MRAKQQGETDQPWKLHTDLFGRAARDLRISRLPPTTDPWEYSCALSQRWFAQLHLVTGKQHLEFTPYAGTDYGGEGQPALRAPLIQPQGVAVDRDGSLIFADAGDHRVRRIEANGFVLNVAGN